MTVPLLLAHGGANPFALLFMVVGFLVALPLAAIVTAGLGFALKSTVQPFAPKGLFAWLRLGALNWFFCGLVVCGVLMKACGG
jgi:hypothetical protein